MATGLRLIGVGILLVFVFLVGWASPSQAKFPTILELKVTPNPAGVRDTVVIECTLYAKGAAHTTQRARGGLLSVTIYSLNPRIQVNQFIDRPDGQYDLFEFAWNPPRVGRYQIEVSYSGSGFLTAVRSSRMVTVMRHRPLTTTPPPPTSSTAIVFTPSTTLPPSTTTTTTTTLPPTTTTYPPTTTTYPATTTTLPPVITVPQTTTTWPQSTTTWPQSTTTWPPTTTTAYSPPPTTLPQTSGTGLQETTIGPEPGPTTTTLPTGGGSSTTGAEEPLRAADNKIVTKVRLSARPGPRAGQYLISVEAVTARGRPLDDGDVLITVSGGKLIPGAQGQALLSAAAGQQTLVWREPANSGNKKYRLEATYFGGKGPQGDYRMASASLSLPPAR